MREESKKISILQRRGGHAAVAEAHPVPPPAYDCECMVVFVGFDLSPGLGVLVRWFTS